MLGGTERENNNSNGFEDSRTENGSSQGHNLASTVCVPNSLDSNWVQSAINRVEWGGVVEAAGRLGLGSSIPSQARVLSRSPLSRFRV